MYSTYYKMAHNGNQNNVEPYTFITLICTDLYTPYPP